MQPRGVQERHRNAAQVEALLQDVPCGTGERRDDGAILLQESVEQAGLADVWRSDERDGRSVAHAPAAIVRPGQGLEGGAHLPYLGPDAAFRQEPAGLALLRELDGRLEACHDFRQAIFQAIDLGGDPAQHLVVGHFRLERRARFDQVTDGLGLGCVDSSVQKGAQRELPGSRRARTQRHRRLDEETRHRRASVGPELRGVLAGEAARGPERYEVSVIDRHAVARPAGTVAGSRPCLPRWNSFEATEIALGPDRRTTPMPPRPGGVEMATIVSVPGEGDVEITGPLA